MAKPRNRKDGSGGGNKGGRNRNTGPCKKGGPGNGRGGGPGGGRNRSK